MFLDKSLNSSRHHFLTRQKVGMTVNQVTLLVWKLKKGWHMVTFISSVYLGTSVFQYLYTVCPSPFLANVGWMSFYFNPFKSLVKTY